MNTQLEYMIVPFAEGTMTSTIEDDLDEQAKQGWRVVCALPTMGEGRFHRFLLERKKPAERKEAPVFPQYKPVYWVLARLTDKGRREYLGASEWWARKLTPMAKVFTTKASAEKHARKYSDYDCVGEAVYRKVGA